MKNIFFPTTIIDGFFEDVDEVRKIALMQEYSNTTSDYPGVRSRKINEISGTLFEAILTKFLSPFYEGEGMDISASMYFQLIDKEFDSGVVHRDSFSVATGIIYLNPNEVSGTSLYEKKNILVDPIADKRYFSFRNNRKDKETKNKINDHYDEVVSISGLYNRAVFFDSHLYHGAQYYHGQTIEDSRLTIITFFERISSQKGIYPIQRFHKNTTTII